MIYDLIETLVQYGLKNELFEDSDTVYMRNKLIDFLNIDTLVRGSDLNLTLEELIDGFCAYAIEHNMINDTITERDLFDTALIGVLVDRPSNVIKKFNDLYRVDKVKATDWFYKFNNSTNYVRSYRIKKDLVWERKNDKYGRVVITVNLSKPEKDPKEIAKAKNMPKSNYPICLLCKENEGYKGRLNHPARQTIRLVPITLQGEEFFLQYSPYSYYNEHCIVLSSEHKPMVIDKKAFLKLLDFETLFPHYFVGSNADLPIVGGSILAHEHFQGGRYRFPMQDAKSIYDFKFKGYPTVNASIIKWPLSVIRISSKSKEDLANLSDEILNYWIDYSDYDVEIHSHTDGVRHNTITPIARINDEGLYELDLTLRNNRTSSTHPLGIFHPHEEYHHIKKENIGLIEVMGLAVLPSRLKTELKDLGKYLVSDDDITKDEVLAKHGPWVKELKQKHKFTLDNYMTILEDEVAQVFLDLLENCGVFKQTEVGINHFKKFIDAFNNR